MDNINFYNKKQEQTFNSIKKQLSKYSVLEIAQIIGELNKLNDEREVLYDGNWMSKGAFNKLSQELGLEVGVLS